MRQCPISGRIGQVEAGAAAALTDKPSKAAETLKSSKHQNFFLILYIHIKTHTYLDEDIRWGVK